MVEVVNHLVFADPDNTEARELQADAFEQLGYQSESATFRNAYLMGAQELRNGHPNRNPAMRRGYLDAMTIDQLMDAIAVRLVAEDVGGVDVVINLTVTDASARDRPDWKIDLSNRALHTSPGARRLLRRGGHARSIGADRHQRCPALAGRGDRCRSGIDRW